MENRTRKTIGTEAEVRHHVSDSDHKEKKRGEPGREGGKSNMSKERVPRESTTRTQFRTFENKGSG